MPIASCVVPAALHLVCHHAGLADALADAALLGGGRRLLGCVRTSRFVHGACRSCPACRHDGLAATVVNAALLGDASLLRWYAGANRFVRGAYRLSPCLLSRVCRLQPACRLGEVAAIDADAILLHVEWHLRWRSCLSRRA